MNIVVLGGGFRNKGNEAMLRVVQAELNQRIKGANIFAVLHNPMEHELAYASGITPLTILNSRVDKTFGRYIANRASVSLFLMRKGSLGGLVQSVFSFWDSRNKAAPRMIDEIVGGLDAVIDIHGYAFGDPWSLQGFREAAAWGEYCRNHGKPFCFLPQSWGPFEKQGYAEAARGVLRNASLFYARETLSQGELAKALQKPAEEIPIAPDSVFRFSSGPSALGENVLRQVGLEPQGKPLIGITPNMRVYERTKGDGSANEYVQLLCRVCTYCIEDIGANVILLSNEVAPMLIVKAGKPCQDDRYLCNMIASIVARPSSCFALRDYCSAEEVRSAVSCLDLLIGSRFHTLVFALSAGVPLVALGWAHKYEGLLKQFGLGDYFCNYSEFSVDSVLGLVSKAWENRVRSAQHIQSSLPGIQAQLDAVFDEVARTVHHPAGKQQ